MHRKNFMSVTVGIESACQAQKSTPVMSAMSETQDRRQAELTMRWLATLRLAVA